MTNVDPPMPMKNLIIMRPVDVLTRPVRPVGMALQSRITTRGIRGPNLSQNGPKTKRMIIVPDTAEIEDDQISSFVRSSDTCTSERSGEMENLSIKADRKIVSVGLNALLWRHTKDSRPLAYR